MLFGKKKEVPICSCQDSCATTETAKTASACCPEAETGICCIKVLGAGCKSCHEQYENVKAAIKILNLPVEVEYITDMQKVMEYGVMSMPAVVVNDRVVSMGKILRPAEIEKMLQKYN